MDVAERERRLGEAALGFPPRVRLALLRVIMASEDRRSEAIGALWAERPGDPMAELLMDLESDRGLALDLAAALKDSLPPDNRG